jgi:hypothetical protein
MLTAKAEILFFKHNNTNDGIDAKIILRPAFNFGEGLLISGNIMNNNLYDTYLYNKKYLIKLEFPTIVGEAYKEILPLLKIGMNLDIQTGAKLIGKAELLEFIYI